MATFNVEVENAQKYTILKNIQNYYTDFVSNPMAREDEKATISKIISEIFSEERNGFNHFVVDYFSKEENGEKIEIDYDSLKEVYNEYALEQTASMKAIRPAKWVGEKQPEEDDEENLKPKKTTTTIVSWFIHPGIIFEKSGRKKK